MDQTLIEEAILKTLKYFAIKESPLTLEELFIYTDTSIVKSNIKKDEYINVLDQMCLKHLVSKYGEDIEYYSLYGSQFKRRKPLIPEIKLPKSFIILFATINNIFLDNLDNDTPHFYAVVKNNTLNISKYLINRKLKTLKCKKYVLNIVEEKDAFTLVKVKDLNTAYLLISLHPLINDLKFYEYFLYKNLWIFNYLGNYPLDRINLSYRSSYKVEPAGFFITLLSRYF